MSKSFTAAYLSPLAAALLCVICANPAAAQNSGLPSGAQIIRGQNVTLEPGANNNSLSINSASKNNVIKWQNFDIAKDKGVWFDHNNYLNLVGGSKPTLIQGTLESFGRIYIVNPNGITLARGSQVHVQHLGLSTAKLNADHLKRFADSGKLELTHKGMGRLTMLGELRSADLSLDGGQLVIRDSTQIKNMEDAGPLSIENAKLAMASSVQRIDIGSSQGDRDYQQEYGLTSSSGLIDHDGEIAISDADELKHIADNLKGSYWLTNNLDEVTLDTPIGDQQAFSGKLDGAFHTINYSLQADDQGQGHNYGLFSQLKGAAIENLKLKHSSLKLDNLGADSKVGALAGTIQNSRLKQIEIADPAFELNPADVGANPQVGGLSGNLTGSRLNNVTVAMTDVQADLLNKSGFSFGTFSAKVNDLELSGLTGSHAAAGAALSSDPLPKGLIEINQSSTISDENYLMNQDGIVTHKGFGNPFFVEDFSFEYDGSERNYIHNTNNMVIADDGTQVPIFDLRDYVSIDGKILSGADLGQSESQAGVYAYALGSDPNAEYPWYFVHDQRIQYPRQAEAVIGTGTLTITPRHLGTIEIKSKDITEGDAVQITHNGQDLNFAPGESFEDLNLGLTIKDQEERTHDPDNFTGPAGEYHVSLTHPKDKSKNDNYTYEIQEDSFTVKAKEIVLPPDPPVTEEPELKPDQRPNLQDLYALTRQKLNCDVCTTRDRKLTVIRQEGQLELNRPQSEEK